MKDLVIIIVNWNTQEMTIECLQSIYANGVKNSWSIVVVDNNSQDKSVELIKKKFPQVVLFENTDNVGFAAANNQVLRKVDAKNYLLLNSDTLVLGDVIKKSIAFINSEPTIGGMGCRVLNKDKTVQLTCSRFPTIINLLLQLFALDKFKKPSFLCRYQYRSWRRDSERDVEVISGCYLMLKREVVEQVGLLDENFFFFGEETDWCKRIKKAGWRLVFSPVGEIIHFGGGSVKKLKYKRDLLLSNAIVNLHKKHYGFISAAVVAIIIFLFTLTRGFGWGLIYLFSHKKDAKERSLHFIKSLPLLHTIWKRNLKFK